jgi:putative acetyltransferase
LIIRRIEKQDNVALAKVIRGVLTEYGINKSGTVFTDPTTDDLFTLFQQQNSDYWVAELDGEIVGGCGIYPTIGLPKGCIELVKLYLDSRARGFGLGKRLMELSIKEAERRGYNSIYLETLSELSDALGLYEKLGFKLLNGPLGNSGHFACNIWMVKKV